MTTQPLYIIRKAGHQPVVYLTEEDGMPHHTYFRDEAIRFTAEELVNAFRGVNLRDSDIRIQQVNDA